MRNERTMLSVLLLFTVACGDDGGPTDDGGMETADAAIDAFMPSDADADLGMDETDSGMDDPDAGPPPAPIRALTPWSGSVVSGPIRVSWIDAMGTVELRVCTDRACTDVVATESLTGGETTLDALAAGRYWWQVSDDRGEWSPPWPFRSLGDAGPGRQWLEGGDFDGDGTEDAVIQIRHGIGEDDTAQVIYGDAARALSLGTRVPATDDSFEDERRLRYVGDVDGDGYGDALNLATNPATLHLGSSEGLVHPGVDVPTRIVIEGFEVGPVDWVPLGDANGDGYADALLGYDDFGTLLGELFTGSPSGLSATGDRLETRSGLVGGMDLDGDGLGDFVSMTDDSWWSADGDGTFTETAFDPALGECRGYPWGKADVDGDGRVDLVGSSSTTACGSVLVLVGSASGFTYDPAFRAEPSSDGIRIEGADLPVGDFDCDGLGDAALVRARVGTDTWLSTGSAYGDRQTIGPAITGFGHMVTADFDGDGCADIAHWGNPDLVCFGAESGPSCESTTLFD